MYKRQSLRIRELLARIPASAKAHREQIEELVDNELFTFRKMYLKDREITNLIGIGENILYMMRQMQSKPVGDKVEASVLNTFYEKFNKLTLDQVEERFGVNAEYASLLMPTVMVYKRILELTGAQMFWIPGIRLCDGIAAEYADDTRLVRDVYKRQLYGRGGPHRSDRAAPGEGALPALPPGV